MRDSAVRHPRWGASVRDPEKLAMIAYDLGALWHSGELRHTLGEHANAVAPLFDLHRKPAYHPKFTVFSFR